MTKADFVAKVAEKSGFSKKDSETALNSVLACLSEAMQKGDSITFTGFGSFKVISRAACKGRDRMCIVVAMLAREQRITPNQAAKFYGSINSILKQLTKVRMDLGKVLKNAEAGILAV